MPKKICVPTFRVKKAQTQVLIELKDDNDQWGVYCDSWVVVNFLKSIVKKISDEHKKTLSRSSFSSLEESEQYRLRVQSILLPVVANSSLSFSALKKRLGKASKNKIILNQYKKTFVKTPSSSSLVPVKRAPSVPPPPSPKKVTNLELLSIRLESGFSPETKDEGMLLSPVRRSKSSNPGFGFFASTDSLSDEILTNEFGQFDTESDLKLVHEFVEIFASSCSTEQIFESLLQHILIYTGANHLYFIRHNSSSDPLVLAASISQNRTWSLLKGLPLPRSPHFPLYILDKARLSREPVIIHSREQLQRNFRETSVLESALCIPLVLRQVFSGCIYIYHSSKKRAFQNVNQTLLTSLGIQLLVFVQNFFLWKHTIDITQKKDTLTCLQGLENVQFRNTMHYYAREDGNQANSWKPGFVVLTIDSLYLFSSPMELKPLLTISISKINSLEAGPAAQFQKRKIVRGIVPPPINKKEAKSVLFMTCVVVSGTVYWLGSDSNEKSETIHESLRKVWSVFQGNNCIPDNLRINPSFVVRGDVIGNGAAAVVYSGKWNSTKVAIKQLLEQFDDVPYEKAFFDEMNMLQDLHHPNIITLFGGFINEFQRPSIVFEFAQRGSLTAVLYGSSAVLPFSLKLRILTQTAQALAYLHSFVPSIIHRDLKPDNILVTEDWNVKLADFGLARRMAKEMTQGQGTAKWMAPEVLSNAQYTIKADIYSFALIMWEVLTQKRLFEEFLFDSELAFQVITHDYRPSLTDVDPLLRSLLTQCWDVDAALRPPATLIAAVLQTILDQHAELS